MLIDLIESADLFPVADSFMVDRADADAALALVDRHGAEASFQAAVRAEENRAIGNVANFCRWRQIERLIAAMQAQGATVH